MEDKIILKFKTKNILNFYEIEPRLHTTKKSCPASPTLQIGGIFLWDVD